MSRNLFCVAPFIKFLYILIYLIGIDMKLYSEIIRLLKENPYRTFKPKELAQILQIPAHQYRHFRNQLKKMVVEGKIYKYRRGRIGMGKSAPQTIGRIQIKAKGYGFLIPEGEGEDIFIGEKNLGMAFNGDLVRVEFLSGPSDRKREGRVVEILERAMKNIVGIYVSDKRWGRLIPDDSRINREIKISKEKSKDAMSGQKVVVRLLRWEDENASPEGEIVEVLGYPGEAGMDVLSLAKSHNLETEFPGKVLKDIRSIPPSIPDKELRRRLDLRKDMIFTIDPVDSKDFDDAVSLKQSENGNYLLGVHIADVSYYVNPNTSVNEIAMQRGTSVYLVDRVIPMLPEHLSNELCSLNENEDRLTFSVLMELTSEAELVRYQIAESVIRSVRRFTYQEVQKIIDHPGLDKKFSPVITRMFQLSKKLLEKREKRGGLDFASHEVKIELNPAGIPIKIEREDQLDSHRLIEEFLVLANATVATHVADISEKGNHGSLPFAYRIHEKPNKEKLADFAKFLAAMGIDFPLKKQVTPKIFQRLIHQIRGTEKEILVADVMVRTMMKAKYDTKNSGHFGLALKNYCHFTSPIRRYPDLICHRLLKDYLDNPDRVVMKKTDLDKICQSATEREIAAQEAERASVRMKKIEYMEQHIGETFDGLISGVVQFGIFVEIIETLVEGLVHVSNLIGDSFTYDETRYCYYGKRTGRVYQLGNHVRVKVMNVNRDANIIDFELLE